MPISEEDRARLKNMGEPKVRMIVMTSGFAPPFHVSALEWLAEREDVERERSEASQSSQMRTALSAKNAAWIAAMAAIAAAVIAITGIIVTVFAWLFPRH